MQKTARLLKVANFHQYCIKDNWLKHKYQLRRDRKNWKTWAMIILERTERCKASLLELYFKSYLAYTTQRNVQERQKVSGFIVKCRSRQGFWRLKILINNILKAGAPAKVSIKKWESWAAATLRKTERS